jgi:hypothetical protein
MRLCGRVCDDGGGALLRLWLMLFSPPPSALASFCVCLSLFLPSFRVLLSLLDANVSVPLIQLLVTNLSAHVALDAKVASLVSLSVGVDLSVQQLNLTIRDVQATVHLEARLHEVTKIVESVMSSLNLSPVLLALATGLVSAVDGLAGGGNTGAGTNTGVISGTNTATSTP